MPQIHDTDNYTVPGGIKLFFTPTGGVERDLGNMVDVSIGRETENLEHYTNRPGTRVKDKVIALSESITIDFNLDEPVIDNFILFFKGDASATQTAGSAGVTDQILSLPTSFGFISVGKPAISAVSARQYIDYCLLYDGVSTYTDNSVEADTLAGTPFNINQDTNDILYIGKATQFKEVGYDAGTSGTYTGSWEYWNGSTWSALTTAGNDQMSGTSGVMTLTVPGDWAQTAVNGLTAYWVRFTASVVTTPATMDWVGRQALVENTDYVVDYGSATQDGRIRGISGGKLVDGERIKTSYTYTTYAALISNLVQSGAAEGAARLEVAPQSGRGLSFDLEFPKCQISSNGDLSLNDQEFMQIPLQLTVLDDTENTPAYPYGRILLYDVSA